MNNKIKLRSLGLVLLTLVYFVVHGWAALALLLLLFISYRFFSLLIQKGVSGASALFATALLWPLLSFLPLYCAPLALVPLLWRPKNLFKVPINFLENIEHKNFWFYFALAFLTCFNGVSIPDGHLAADGLHPTYEISFGHSFSSLLERPDLSYAGKIAKFHFFSTQLPHFLDRTLHLPLLESTYFIWPLFYFALILLFLERHLLIGTFAKIPRWILFLFPIYIEHPLDAKGWYRYLTPLTLSYMLAALFLLLSFQFLRKEKRFNFLATLLVLLITKASFFLVAFGGGVLYYLKQKKWRELFFLCAGTALFFIPLFLIFMKGAHAHNLWIIFPSFIYLPLFNNASTSTFKSLLRLFVSLVPFIFVVYIVCINFIKAKDKNYLALSALALAGILGFSLLSEASEDNSRQFLLCTYPFLILLVLSFIQEKKAIWPSLINTAIKSLFVLGVLFSFRQTLLPQIQVTLALVKNKVTGASVGYTQKKTIVQAYKTLKDLPGKHIVLVAPHYQKILIPGEISSQLPWMGYDFIRSALSGQQFFVEAEKYRGNVIEEDYAHRIALMIWAYSHMTQLSPISQKMMNYYFSFPLEKAISHGDEKGTWQKWRYKLSFKKDWSWPNIEGRVKEQMREELALLPTQPLPEEILLKLQREHIDLIAFELGDRPTSWLAQKGKILYDDGETLILQLLL